MQIDKKNCIGKKTMLNVYELISEYSHQSPYFPASDNLVYKKELWWKLFSYLVILILIDVLLIISY